MSSRFCAADPAVAHVFVDALDDDCTVGGTDGHHLQRVRRLRTGERVTAADGTGAWRAYDVVASSAGEVSLVAISDVVVEPVVQPRVGVAVALIKSGLDQVVARCTELGVEHIEPVRTRRTVVQWDDARATAAVTRWRGVAREAAAQSRRARLPEVRDVVRLERLAGRAGLVLADRSGIEAAALPDPGPQGFTVVVGPEGGLDPDELTLFPAVPRVAVGPHVLRAETAPIAALAAFRATRPDV